MDTINRALKKMWDWFFPDPITPFRGDHTLGHDKDGRLYMRKHHAPSGATYWELIPLEGYRD